MCLLRFASSKCPLTTTFNFSNYSIKSVFRQRWFSSAVDVNTNVAKDVILYKYDNPKHFKWVNIFSLCQFGFWGYLSYFSFTTLRDAPVPVDPDAEVAWWRKINLGDNKYRNTIAISAFLIGYGMLTLTWIYTLKSVRYLILRKGGQQVTIVTYTPFGENRMLTVGLKNICSKEMRSRATSMLPIKVKGHYFHYIMDMKGEFKNEVLFDNTAGLKRSWK